MSIFKKLLFLFIFSLTLMSIIGFWIDSINSNRVDNFVKDKYIKLSDEILKNIENKKYIGSLVSKNNLKSIQHIEINNLKSIYSSHSNFTNIDIYRSNKNSIYFLKIEYLDETYLLQSFDEENLNEKTVLNTLVFLDIFALFLIFLYITKLLFPLKSITKGIKSFANGELSTRININSNDEIGLLANNFNFMANSIEDFIKSRQELLRNIGHELKTPITKGKFILEKIDNKEQRELLYKIFSDLDRLTSDLLELEKLDIIELNISSFSAETLLLHSLEKLYIEDESKINIEIVEDFNIQADFYYLSIALKNLIDNGIKYAKSLPIYIKIDKNEISISNRGAKLSRDFLHYLQPFTQELTQRDGFGLGLSIVKKILDKHGFLISYEHRDGFNHIKIIFK